MNKIAQMPVIPSVIKWINTKRLSQIELFRKYPAETQQEVLTRLIADEQGYSVG